MRNFCTDIQETAKLRGLTKGGECSSRRGSYTIETIDITITYYSDEELREQEEPIMNNQSELKKLFREVNPKEIEEANTQLLDSIIRQFIG